MTPKQNAVWTKSFTSIVGANTVYFFGFYMLMPTLPLYVASLGGDSRQVGAIATAFSVASICIRLLAGYLISRFGKNKMLKIGMLVSALATAAYSLVEQYLGIMALRVVQGLAFGLVSTICATMAADVLPDERRGEGISYFGMGTTVAVALSPTIGLWLKDNFGFNPMFVVAAIGLLASLVVFIIFRPQAESEAAEREPENRVSLIGSLFEPRNTFQCVLTFLFGICRGAETNFLSLMVEDHGIAGLSVYYIVQTGVAFVLKFFAGKMYTRFGHKASLIPGGIAGLACMICLGLTNSTAMLMISGVFSGIAVGAIIPSLQTWSMNNVPSHRRSVASAAYYNFYDLGMGGGAAVLGYIAKAAGYSGMYLWAGVSMVLFMALYLGYLAKKGKMAE